ncbi:ferrochelatase [Caldiplasma sukawensis]
MSREIVLMAYGSPSSKEEIMDYLRDIYHGKEPPEYAIKETFAKYEAFGYKSPSNEILESLVSKLNKNSGDHYVLCFKHWKPSIEETLKNIIERGPEQIVLLPLFPFKNKSVERSYIDVSKKVVEEKNFTGKVKIVDRLNNNLWRNFWADQLKNKNDDGIFFLFSAHSLPYNISEEEDYYNTVRGEATVLSQMARLKNYSFGFQSRGSYGKVWLEPSVYDRLKEIGKEIDEITTVPFGFYYDHLEVLFDLDRLFGEKVRENGFKYSRLSLPNNSEKSINIIKAAVGDQSEEH